MGRENKFLYKGENLEDVGVVKINEQPIAQCPPLEGVQTSI